MNAQGNILPRIDHELCNRCGICVGICPSAAVALIDGCVVIVHPADCNYCGDCEELCPEGAISLPYEIVFAEQIQESMRADDQAPDCTH